MYEQNNEIYLHSHGGMYEQNNEIYLHSYGGMYEQNNEIYLMAECTNKIMKYTFVPPFTWRNVRKK